MKNVAASRGRVVAGDNELGHAKRQARNQDPERIAQAADDRNRERFQAEQRSISECAKMTGATRMPASPARIDEMT